jgi:predicted site-specific integrase-resolvase
VPALADATLIRELLGIPAGTLRQWVNRGQLTAYPMRNGKRQYDYLAVKRIHYHGHSEEQQAA